jgi:hypothetical protein
MKLFMSFLSVVCFITSCMTIFEPNNVADSLDKQKIIDILKSKRWERVSNFDPGRPNLDTLPVPKESRTIIDFKDNNQLTVTNGSLEFENGYWRLERNFDYDYGYRDTVTVRWKIITGKTAVSNDFIGYVLHISSNQLIMTGRGGRHGLEIDFYKPL